MDEDHFADCIRSMIKDENTLENNRLNWMLIIQGLLFVQFAGVEVKLFMEYSLPNKRLETDKPLHALRLNLVR